MTNIFDSNQEKSLTKLMSESQKIKLRQAVLEKLIEKREVEKKAAAPLTEETKPQAPLTGTEKYARTIREQVAKDNRNRPKVIPEKTDLLAGEESVTAAQLRQSNQELWNRVQSSMASLGGGGGDTSRALNKFGDSMHGKLIIGPYEEDSDRSFIEFDVESNDTNLVLESKERGQYINMSNWLLHSDNDSSMSTPNEREYSDVAYGQGKFIASQWMAWWDSPGLSNAVAISEDGENWKVSQRYVDSGFWFDAAAIMYESNNDVWVQVGGLGGPEDAANILWSDDGESWNAVAPPTDGSVADNDEQYFFNVAYSDTLSKFVAMSFAGSKHEKKRIASSTDGRNWSYDSAGEEFDSNMPSVKGLAWGAGKFVATSENHNDWQNHAAQKGGFAWSSDGDSWNYLENNYPLQDAYPTETKWRQVLYAEDKGLWVVAANWPLDRTDADKSPLMWSTDGINWNFATIHSKDRFDDGVKLSGHVVYGDNKFIAFIGRPNSSNKAQIFPTLFWSADGKNWFPNELGRYGDQKTSYWTGGVWKDNKWVAVSGNGDIAPKFATLDHNSRKNSLFVDDAIVATQDNLTPLFKKVNQLASRNTLIYSDSNPFDRDSYAPNYIGNGQMWFDASTDRGQLYVRHNDSWVAI
jgi:hypothetical protein